MPAPLVMAAARLLASKGAREAIKKYGKKIVDEARKHAKDLTTKPTPGQKKIAPVTKAQRATRDTARKSFGVGNVTGGSAGIGGTLAVTSAMSDKKDKPKAKPKAKTASKAGKDQRTNPKDYPTYKKGTPSSKAFQEAYRTAKSNGQKTFTFEGRRYAVK
jgi:hypothetical protein